MFEYRTQRQKFRYFIKQHTLGFFDVGVKKYLLILLYLMISVAHRLIGTVGVEYGFRRFDLR